MSLNVTVSVLINNYNYGRYLRDSIDSALNQTYPHVEVIVVDDGSTDDSPEIIKSYGSRIRPILKRNGGQGSALNAGFMASSGHIIKFLDADDFLKSDAIAKIVSVWTDQTGIVHHRLQIVDGDGKPTGVDTLDGQPLDHGDVTSLLLRQGRYRYVATSGLAYSRMLLARLMPMPESDFRICADTWFIFQAPFFAGIQSIEEELACYRVHGANAWLMGWEGRRMGARKLRDFVRGLDLNYKCILRQASVRGLSTNSDQWDFWFTLRARLLLARVEPKKYPHRELSRLYHLILARIAQDKLSFSLRWRQRAIATFIRFAPRALFRLVFPNLFSEAGSTCLIQETGNNGIWSDIPLDIFDRAQVCNNAPDACETTAATCS